MKFKDQFTVSGFKSSVKYSYRFVLWLVKQFEARRCLTHGAALTYTSLLALVPLLTVALSILSIFPLFKEISNSLQDFVFNNFVPSTSEVIQNYVNQFVGQAKSLPVPSLIFLFVTAVMMMFTLDKAINAVWQVKARRQLGFSILLYWAVLTLGPLLIGASLGISSYIGSRQLLGTWTMSGLKQFWFLVPSACAFIAFWFLYLVVPHCKVRVSHAAFGALAATLLFELAKEVFGWYVSSVPTYRLLYGTMAAIPIFLLWIYLCWCIFLIGALVVNGLRTQAVWHDVRPTPKIWMAYYCLVACYEAQQTQKPLSIHHLLRQQAHWDPTVLQNVLSELVAKQWLYLTQEGHYVTGQDLQTATMRDLLSVFSLNLPSAKALPVNKHDPTLMGFRAWLEQASQAQKDILAMPLLAVTRAQSKGVKI